MGAVDDAVPISSIARLVVEDAFAPGLKVQHVLDELVTLRPAPHSLYGDITLVLEFLELRLSKNFVNPVVVDFFFLNLSF